MYYRYSGASAGGMMPFEFHLKGETATVTTHIMYGLLQEKYPEEYDNLLKQAYTQDHHWRLMSTWQSNKYSSSLSSLNGIVHLALSCLKDFWPQLVMVSEFTSPDQADHAFMTTGTYVNMYSGMLCSDGGSTSGRKMTPLFHDNRGPQLIVDLMQTGRPLSIVTSFTAAVYESMVMQGQDEMIYFLQFGKDPRGVQSITLCPVGEAGDDNECKTKQVKGSVSASDTRDALYLR